MNKIFTIGLVILLVGVSAGWWIRGFFPESETVAENNIPAVESQTVFRPEQSRTKLATEDSAYEPSEFLNLISNDSDSRRVIRLRGYLHKNGDDFEVLTTLSDELAAQGQFDESLEILLRASFVIKDINQQDSFEFRLARLVDQYTKELISLNQFGQVDTLYEMLTLSLPQLAQFHLELGRLRVRMGNDQAALAPLSQIINHDKLGAEARQLVAQIEEAETPGATSMEELPLIAKAGQFLVKAMIDDSQTIMVLIDTGAAMTVLESSVLEGLGYNLSGRLEYFATANGVVQAPVVTVDSIGLGRARLAKVTVGALNLNMPRGVKGLLGWTISRQ